jgi:hypothetical protein
MNLKRIRIGIGVDDIPARCIVWQYAETLGNPFSDEKTVVELLRVGLYSRDIVVTVVEDVSTLNPICRYYIEEDVI